MNTVLVDTNIILWTFSGGPDFREAILKVAPGWDLAIPSCVITELEKLESKEAKAALEMCNAFENCRHRKRIYRYYANRCCKKRILGSN